MRTIDRIDLDWPFSELPKIGDVIDFEPSENPADLFGYEVITRVADVREHSLDDAARRVEQRRCQRCGGPSASKRARAEVETSPSAAVARTHHA